MATTHRQVAPCTRSAAAAPPRTSVERIARAPPSGRPHTPPRWIQVQHHVEPFPITVPPEVYVLLAALAAGAFAMLLVVIGQAARLRACSARLVVVGLIPCWTRGILTLQAGITIALIVTIVAAGAATALAARRLSAAEQPHVT